MLCILNTLNLHKYVHQDEGLTFRPPTAFALDNNNKFTGLLQMSDNFWFLRHRWLYVYVRFYFNFSFTIISICYSFFFEYPLKLFTLEDTVKFFINIYVVSVVNKSFFRIKIKVKSDASVKVSVLFYCEFRI